MYHIKKNKIQCINTENSNWNCFCHISIKFSQNFPGLKRQEQQTWRTWNQSYLYVMWPNILIHNYCLPGQRGVKCKFYFPQILPSAASLLLLKTIQNKIWQSWGKSSSSLFTCIYWLLTWQLNSFLSSCRLHIYLSLKFLSLCGFSTFSSSCLWAVNIF